MLPASAVAHALLPGAEHAGRQDSQRTHKTISTPGACRAEDDSHNESSAARHEGGSGHTSTNSLNQAPWPPLLSTLITMGFGGTHCTRLPQRTQHQITIIDKERKVNLWGIVGVTAC